MKSISDLEGALNDVLSRDRVRLAQRLRTSRRQNGNCPEGLTKLSVAFARSIARRQARAASLPQPGVDPDLPIAAHTAAIIEAIRRHPVLVLAGATGSGKTTQLPKLCLAAGRGAAGLIGCTQPRRLAARSMARRVAAELGGEPGELVGYQVRFQEQLSPETCIKFMTDGILLAETQSDRE
ncbi:MAG TPA: ATP-dependent helicase, partial [Mizugakiibacter sp.]|nr:ATP-dependent helicase [Mizugakiibacter sp.]